jgi:proton glutamate symport protein
MARTMVNLVGNCLATAVMARWEGELAAEPAIAPLSPASASVTPAPSDA